MNIQTCKHCLLIEKLRYIKDRSSLSARRNLRPCKKCRGGLVNFLPNFYNYRGNWMANEFRISFGF